MNIFKPTNNSQVNELLEKTEKALNLKNIIIDANADGIIIVIPVENLNHSRGLAYRDAFQIIDKYPFKLAARIRILTQAIFKQWQLDDPEDYYTNDPTLLEFQKRDGTYQTQLELEIVYPNQILTQKPLNNYFTEEIDDEAFWQKPDRKSPIKSKTNLNQKQLIYNLLNLKDLQTKPVYQLQENNFFEIIKSAYVRTKNSKN